MRTRLLLILLPLLSGCRTNHQNQNSASTFNQRMRCAQLATSGQWENLTDGPYLDKTYYSPASDTCIFVMKQAFPSEKDGEIQDAYFIIDALTRKQLWSNDPKKGETEAQLEATLDQELSKLQVIK
jgi:hypothetical protein